MNKHLSLSNIYFLLIIQCPSRTEVDTVRRAVAMGDVVWHAGPMNMQFENFMDPVMLDLSLNISTNLDREFGINRTTPVVSQRDVPGSCLWPFFGRLEKLF